MLLDFLYDCQCALENEKTDFQETLKNLSNKSLCVGFMPAITEERPDTPVALRMWIE